MASRTCYVSCVDSGPNPSPGLGVARSLRDAFPDLRLVAVAYSKQTSGFHDGVFDEVWMLRPWDEMNLELYASQITQRLDEEALFFSNLDLETRWLAQALGAHSQVPIPSLDALNAVSKPNIAPDAALPLRVPPYIYARRPDEDLHAFGRRENWTCWLKGPSHEALPITHWQDIGEARDELEDRWSTESVFLQAHREGQEESILFVAHDGHLLGAVRMEKTRTTGHSKTWSGRLTSLNDALHEALAQTVADLDWTGGAEIECIRTGDNDLWVIDWNPRFPGWIYGASLHGFNGPAALAAVTWGTDPSSFLSLESSPVEFTRVVTEIPVRRPVPSEDGDTSPFASAPTKVPTDMPALAQRVNRSESSSPVSSPDRSTPAVRPLSADLRAILEDLPAPLPETPASVLLPGQTEKRFRRFQQAAGTVSQALGDRPFHVAYSVKTNPHPRLLNAARTAGMWAETIHPDEVDHAIQEGFPPDEIVLNGPFQRDLHEHLPGLRAAFADTLDDLAAMAAAPNPPSICGLRVRPAQLSSRFGLPLTDPDVFDRCCEQIDALPSDVRLGLHVHHASSTAGHDRWWNYLRGAVHWGAALASQTDRSIRVLDFGGGWHPDDWLDVFVPGLINRAADLLAHLPDLEMMIAEPGKALCQPLGVVVSRVVDLRRGRAADAPPSAVLDASIAELSNVDFHPHRICARSDGDWYRLSRGPGRLYGRLCMEEDVLVPHADLRRLSLGDPVVFCDAGAYDMSMTYPFGRGESVPARRTRHRPNLSP